MKAHKAKVLRCSIFFLLCQSSCLFSQAQLSIVDETGKRTEFEIAYLQVTAGLKILCHQKAIAEMRLEEKTEAEINSFLADRRSLCKRYGSGAISGKVIYGDDHLFDVTVALYTEFGEFIAQDSTRYILNGEYEFVGLADGGYYVLMAPADGSGFVREFYNGVIDWQEAALLRILNGASVTGIDFELKKGASISGAVYGEDGTTPLANTVVEFGLYDAIYRWWGVMQTTQSDYLTGNICDIKNYRLDNSGRYKIAGIGPGHYKIALTSSGRSYTFYNQAKNWLNARPIAIEGREEEITNIDFALERASTLNVSLLDSDSNPVTTNAMGCMVYPVDSVGGRVYTSLYDFNPSTGNPNYCVKVSPGSYFLVGTADGYGWKFYDNAVSLGDATVVKAGSGETQQIYLKLGSWRPALALGIKVFDQKGQLVRRVKHGWKLYTLHYGQYHNNNSYRASFLSLVPDRYTCVIWPFTGPEDTFFSYSFGDYYLNIEDKLHPPEFSKTWDFPFAHKFLGDVHSFRQADFVELIPGDTVDVELHLSGGGVSGRVWQAGGNTPMAEAFIFIYNADTGEKIGMTKTDENGLYGIENLCGNFRILARTNDDFPYLVGTYYGNVPDMGDATTVMVPDTGMVRNLHIVMQEAGAICGQIVSDFDFSSLMNTAVVAAFDARSGKFAGWDDLGFNGRYCVSHLPEGDYKVCCYFRKELADHVECTAAYYGGGKTFDDDSSAAVSVLKKCNAIADIRVVEGLAQISGNVIDAVSGHPALSDPNSPRSGAPLGRYDRMILYDRTGHLAAMATLRIGSFDLRGLACGDYFLRSDIGSWEYLDQWHDGSAIPLNQEDPFDYWIDKKMDKRNMNFFWGTSSYFVADNIPANSSPLRLDSNPVHLNLCLTKSTATLVREQKTFAPTSFVLMQNHPNPFNPETTIEYQLPQPAQIRLAIYNLLGQEIKTLVDGERPAGRFAAQWHGRNEQGQMAPSGVYLYRLQAGGIVDLKKMLLIR